MIENEMWCQKLPSFNPLPDIQYRKRARELRDKDEGVTFLGAKASPVPLEYCLSESQIKNYSTKDMLILSDGGAILERIAPNGLSEISEDRQFLLDLYLGDQIAIQVTDKDIRLQEIHIFPLSNYPNPFSSFSWHLTLGGAFYRAEQLPEATSQLKNAVKAIACIVKLLPDDGVSLLASYWREG